MSDADGIERQINKVRDGVLNLRIIQQITSEYVLIPYSDVQYVFDLTKPVPPAFESLPGFTLADFIGQQNEKFLELLSEQRLTDDEINEIESRWLNEDENEELSENEEFLIKILGKLFGMLATANGLMQKKYYTTLCMAKYCDKL